MSGRIYVILIASLLDIILGDPHYIWHPIRGMGKLIEVIETFLRKILHISDETEEDIKKKRIAGGILVLFVLAISAAVPAIILFFMYRINSYLGIAIEGFMCYQLLAMKSLKDESMKVYKELKKSDIKNARYAVSMIVGRDTEMLDEEGVTKAAVETVAENTSDGVVAPMLYIFFFGAVGGYIYKAVNTMDSMIGYRNDRYKYFGTIAARLDDLLNLIPARLAAIYMIIVAFILPGFSGRNAVRIFIRDRYKHKSPNSAFTESVCAGALRIQLAGNAYYFGKLHEKPYIGEPLRQINADDIKRANVLLVGTFLLSQGLSLCLAYIVNIF